MNEEAFIGRWIAKTLMTALPWGIAALVLAVLVAVTWMAQKGAQMEWEEQNRMQEVRDG